MCGLPERCGAERADCFLKPISLTYSVNQWLSYHISPSCGFFLSLGFALSFMQKQNFNTAVLCVCVLPVRPPSPLTTPPRYVFLSIHSLACQ